MQYNCLTNHANRRHTAMRTFSRPTELSSDGRKLSLTNLVKTTRTIFHSVKIEILFHLLWNTNSCNTDFSRKQSRGTMIVRSVQDILNTDRDVRGDVWASRRLLLAKDGAGLGFSLNETTVEAGAVLHLWYKHHMEANYIVDGEGTVEDVATGQVHPLKPGTTYTLDKHDKHIMRATTKMKFLCVFNPPLTGRETHDADGSYVPPPKEEEEES
jgi:L-ectoine synthase